MNATELFRAGKLTEAIDAQIKEVKSAPADQNKRLFLFELLAFSGDLDRARRQADAIQYDDPKQAAALASYIQLMEAEKLRRRLFSESLKPQFFADIPEHVQLRLEAVNRLRENKPAEATELLHRANEAAPAVKGLLNDKIPFTSLRDADDLLAHVLEVFAHGNYYWVPLEQVQGLAANPPKTPRDLLWFPARLEMAEAAGDVFLPVLYPGSHENADPQIKLGRANDWKTLENGPVLGVGQHLFLAGDHDLPLLEVRQLQRATE